MERIVSEFENLAPRKGVEKEGLQIASQAFHQGKGRLRTGIAAG